MRTLIFNIYLILRFLATYSEHLDKRFVRRHYIFCKIHDIIITCVGLFGAFCFLLAVGTIEGSVSTGWDFVRDCLVAIKWVGLGLGIITLIASSNDMWNE